MSARESSPAAQSRQALSRATILETAIRVADEGGVDGVAKMSMRSLARELGFEVMSLYNHIANKAELLAAMVDETALEVPAPDPYGDPMAAVRFIAVETQAALVRHPWAAGLWQESLPGPGRLRIMERLLAAFAATELSHEVAHHGYHAVINHVLGYTLQAQALSMGDSEEEAMAVVTSFLDSFDAAEFPHTVEHVHQHLRGETGPSFELVLDLILDGLVRLDGAAD